MRNCLLMGISSLFFVAGVGMADIAPPTFVPLEYEDLFEIPQIPPPVVVDVGDPVPGLDGEPCIPVTITVNEPLNPGDIGVTCTLSVDGEWVGTLSVSTGSTTTIHVPVGGVDVDVSPWPDPTDGLGDWPDVEDLEFHA